MIKYQGIRAHMERVGWNPGIQADFQHCKALPFILISKQDEEFKKECISLFGGNKIFWDEEDAVKALKLFNIAYEDSAQDEIDKMRKEQPSVFGEMRTSSDVILRYFISQELATRGITPKDKKFKLYYTEYLCLIWEIPFVSHECFTMLSDILEEISITQCIDWGILDWTESDYLELYNRVLLMRKALTMEEKFRCGSRGPEISKFYYLYLKIQGGFQIENDTLNLIIGNQTFLSKEEIKFLCNSRDSFSYINFENASLAIELFKEDPQAFKTLQLETFPQVNGKFGEPVSQDFTGELKKVLNSYRECDELEKETITVEGEGNYSIRIENSILTVNGIRYSHKGNLTLKGNGSKAKLAVLLLGEMPQKLILDNLDINPYEYRKPTIYVRCPSAIIEIQGEVKIGRSEESSPIEIGEECSQLEVSGQGSLELQGNYISPGIGVSGISQSWGRWTEPREKYDCDITIRDIKITVNNCPNNLGIGIYSKINQTAVRVKYAKGTNYQGIPGAGKSVKHFSVEESGSTKMSTPLEVRDISPYVEHVQPRYDPDLEHLRESGVSFELMTSLKEEQDLLVFQAVEDVSRELTRKWRLSKTHPLYESVKEFPVLGTYMREDSDDSEDSEVPFRVKYMDFFK